MSMWRNGWIHHDRRQSVQCSAKPTNLELHSRRRDAVLLLLCEISISPLLPSSVTPYPTQLINPPNRHLGATLPPEHYLPPFPASDTSVCVYIQTCGFRPPTLLIISTHLTPLSLHLGRIKFVHE